MFENKRILVIGGTGTIGKFLVQNLLQYHPDTVRVYSRDEYKQFVMQQDFSSYSNIRYLIGDVRDKERLNRAMNNIDIVFNLAAMKHVPACEYNPIEAVKTNVIGTQNVIECAIMNRVEKVIYTSSDKAVSPTNTMGATKLLAERLMSSADSAKGAEIPVLASVRFGNVLGSRGSVIPLWKDQIVDNGCVTVTNPNMTRFMMSIQQAIQLLIKAAYIAQGGEVFVLKMPVIRLGDMADVIIKNQCINMNISGDRITMKNIGLRPGEKMFEELMTAQESITALEYDDMFAILPYHKVDLAETYGAKKAEYGEYSSNDVAVLTNQEIAELLQQSDLI
jgi:FlaA1/EpsC-like NDP-sugar epimerase